jgi:hypothetical protein
MANWSDKEFVKQYHRQYYQKQKEQNKYTDCICGKQYLNICKNVHYKSKHHLMYEKLKNQILNQVQNIT